MFVLSPIAPEIQKKLKQKQNWMQRISAEETSHIETGDIAPGEWNMPIDWESPENVSQIFARSTWIRMSSATGLSSMISIVGGELSDDSGENIRWGGPTSNDSDDSSLLYRNNVIQIVDNEVEIMERSSGWRPVAGIKSLSSEYQNYSVRNTTISWVAWDFETIETLTPFFLSNGSSVLVEWGWSTQENLNLELSKPVDFHTANTELKSRILANKGDYDAVIGMVKNFQWKTRDDGGFDCTTELTSMGVNILEQSYPGSSDLNVADKSQQITVASNELPPVLEEIREARTEMFFDDIEHQLKWMFFWGYKKTVAATEDIEEHKVTPFRTNFSCGILTGKNDSPKDWDINYSNDKPSNAHSSIGPYVTWGWMEDNILNRFFGFFDSESGNSRIEIRSILPIMEEIVNDDGTVSKVPKTDEDKNGNEKVVYESTKCLNSEHLYTTDINRFILKGQPSEFGVPKTTDIKAENAVFANIEKFIDRTNRFPTFAVDDDKTQGYIRNIILHWSTIKDSFVGAGSLLNGMNNLFSILNAETGGIWNFELITDSENNNRMIVIDKNNSEGEVTPAVGFKDNSEYNRSTNENYQFNGLYIFPLFSNASIVKSQNIETNITSEMGTMMVLSKYGNPSNQYENIVKIKDGHPAADLIGKLFNPEFIKKSRSQAKASEIIQHLEKQLDPYFSALEPAKMAGLGSAVGNSTGDENDKLNKFKVGQDPIDAFKYDALRARNQTFSKVTEYIRSQIVGSTQKQTDKTKESYDEQIIELMNQLGADTTDIEIDFSVVDFPTNPKYGEKSTTQLYNDYGIMFDKWKTIMVDKIMNNADGIIRNMNPVVPLEISLEIDGTGGIFPGNSFHTNYLPERYTRATCFQVTGLEHSIDSSGWTTTIKGLMTIFMDILLKEYAAILDDIEKNKAEDAPVPHKMTSEEIQKLFTRMEALDAEVRDLGAKMPIKLDISKEQSLDIRYQYTDLIIGEAGGFHGDNKWYSVHNFLKKNIDGPGFDDWNHELHGNFKKWHKGDPEHHTGDDTDITENGGHQRGKDYNKTSTGSSVNEAIWRILLTMRHGGKNTPFMEIYDENTFTMIGAQANGVFHDLYWLATKQQIWLKIFAQTELMNLLRWYKGKLYFHVDSVKNIRTILANTDTTYRKELAFDMELGPWTKSKTDAPLGPDAVSFIPDNWNKEGSIWPKRIDPLSIGGVHILDINGKTISPNLSQLTKKITHGPLPPSEEWVSRDPADVEWIPQKLYNGDSVIKSPKQYLKSIWDSCLDNTSDDIRHNAYPMGGTGHNYSNSDLISQCEDVYAKWANIQEDKTLNWSIEYGNWYISEND